MGILTRMVTKRCEEKPDSRLAPYKDDVKPLMEGMSHHKEDPDVLAAYAKV